MKITIHRCDFCGAKRPSGTMAKLTIPLSEEDRKLKKRIERTTIHDEVVGRPMSPYARFYAHLGMAPPESPTTTTMDVCQECVRGLLMCRFREIRKLVTEEE